MKIFTGQNTISAIKRQVVLSGKSSYVAVAIATTTCYLRPLTEEQAAANSLQWGTGFNVITETDVAMQEGDLLTIASVDYSVRGVVTHDRGGILAYKRALVLKRPTP